MECVSRGQLQEWCNEALNRGDYKEADLLRDIIGCCKELNPWRRVDDGTPRDRRIRLLYPKSGDNYDRLVLEIKYTHYFELHSQRKPRYWQEITPDPA